MAAIQFFLHNVLCACQTIRTILFLSRTSWGNLDSIQWTDRLPNPGHRVVTSIVHLRGENFKRCFFFLFFRIDVVNNRKREWQTKENNFYIWENFHVDAYNVQWACVFFDSPEFSHILLMTFVFFKIFARNYF